MQSSEAKLDVATGQVICDECGGVVAGVTEQFKNILKQNGQIVRSKAKQAFQTFCKNCKGNTDYAVDGDGKAFCKVCKQPVSVSPFFQRAAQMNAEKKAKDGDE
jgi:hypothetical protein